MADHTVQLRYLRIAPRKARLVADVLRGMPVNEAEARLLMMRQRAAKPILKLLRSGIAGAKEKRLPIERLFIKEIRVDGGPMLHRYMPRARGSMSEIQKKMSHVIMGFAENPNQKPGKYSIPVKEKRKKNDEGERRVRKAKPAKEEASGTEPKKQAGFFKRRFGRKSGDA